ncbi:hypothetical protein ACF09C_01090 [Streptomyces sp. NPDC014870]|uniref:hypothetical protein n=1 Tax=Streptomyces sp. NPDC014870 TaxID=3364925 RepID=UPI003701429C
MVNDDLDSVGTAVLLAAAPAGRGRAVDAAAVLPAFAAVPPGALTGTPVATVVELADPLDPQTVLTRLRSAAAAPGPLALFLAGQLQVDRRQHLPHLALARSTATTLRYTALPWHWLAAELAVRRAGTTTVVADLVADAELWERLGAAPGLLSLGPGIRLYGRVAPTPRRSGAPMTPEYLRHFATVWRTGARPPLAHLHAEAATQAGPGEAVWLAQEAVGPDGVNPRVPQPSSHPVQVGGRAAVATPAALPALAVVATPAVLPVPAAVPEPHPEHGRATAVAAPSSVRPPAPAARETTPGAGSAYEPPVRAASAHEPSVREPSVREPDPHPAILEAARAGRHGEAVAVAVAWEQAALRRFGARSPEAVHWMEVRADLARLAEEPARSCELWIAVARARLALGQGPQDPEVEGAVDRAHHQWERIEDPARARELGNALVALRRRVPGRRAGALAALQRRMV